MLDSFAHNIPKVLLVGVGDLTMRLAHILASTVEPLDLVVASRTLERAARFANLTKLAAVNLGHIRDVQAVELDLPDVSRTAEEIRRIRPDIIFMGASIQAARAIMDLPTLLFRQLDEAQLGPWLPMHLTLTYELMQAVRLSGFDTVVVNSAYPDAVGPALASIGLAPQIGIGNIGNVVPGITWAVARQLGVKPDDVTVKVVGHHYFSHHVHRFGEAHGIPYVLHASVLGEPAAVDAERVFAELASRLRRQGGKDGQQLTASSAARVIFGLLSDQPVQMHAPAPEGLVGGYPVLVSRQGIELDLPSGVDAEAAQATNRRCQQIDGIASIMAGGIVQFTDERMAVLHETIGYRRDELKVEEARQAATELGDLYTQFLATRGIEA